MVGLFAKMRSSAVSINSHIPVRNNQTSSVSLGMRLGMRMERRFGIRLCDIGGFAQADKCLGIWIREAQVHRMDLRRQRKTPARLN